MADELDLSEVIKERFGKLPKVVQDAITSADIQKRLRQLADTHQLHVDQWESLENEVMLTLLGIEAVENFEKNLTNEVGVTPDIAHTLAESVNSVVFEPIREELERQLEHPQAQAENVSEIEAARTQILGGGAQEAPPAMVQPPPPPIVPATPPAPPPEVSVARAPASGAYKPGEASTERASVVDDPYREPPQ